MPKTKSTVHKDALGSFEAFKAPWESEAGADAEIDKPKLKRLIFNLKTDYATARDVNEDAKADLAEATTALEEAKTAAADANGPEAQKQIDKLTRERDAALAKVEEFETAKEIADLRAEVLGDFETQFPKAAKYVVGTTKEELEASLEAVRDDFGLVEGGDDDADENETDEEVIVRTTPRRTTTIVNPNDKANGKSGAVEIDWDKWADEQVSTRF